MNFNSVLKEFSYLLYGFFCYHSEVSRQYVVVAVEAQRKVDFLLFSEVFVVRALFRNGVCVYIWELSRATDNIVL